MSEFLFALGADGIRMGDIDTELPLYCALFRFRRESTPEQVIMETRALIERFPPIDLHSIEQRRIGWCNNVPVHRIRRTAELQKLHDTICADQMLRGAVPVNPDRIGEGYDPYVLDRGNRCLPVGTTYRAHFVTLYTKNEKLGTLIEHTHIRLIGR